MLTIKFGWSIKIRSIQDDEGEGLGQILTAVIHMIWLVIQFEGLREMLYLHITMIWIKH